jgi:hypothetical protein
LNAPVVLHLDRSDRAHIYVERDGERVDLEKAFSEGFTVLPNDAPAVLSLVAQFLKSKDEHRM